MLGSLGPNQDRILALAARVDGLVYAYTEFHPSLVRLEKEIVCIPLARRNLVPQVRYLLTRYEISIIYSLLSAADQSTEVTLEVLDGGIAVPIVRHYKEHPCIPTLEERRILLDTAGQIYINRESLEYFRRIYGVSLESAHIVDADMIAERYMSDDFSEKLRLQDGEPHLLVAGGMSMLSDRLDVRELCVEMDRRHVHVHLFGYVVGKGEDGCPIVGHIPTLRAYEDLEGSLSYVHRHAYVPPAEFCPAWSRYDAGFMHTKVDPHDKTAAFEELNLPYRYTAYLAAGLPLAVPKEGQRAMRSLVESCDVGVIYSDYDDLAAKLHDENVMAALSSEARGRRRYFSFDSNADKLIEILKRYSAAC